jgi:hypothetical protein
MTAAKGRKKPDWQAIEREYRAGQLSDREISRQHGVSHTAIQKRAKAEGWVKDLAEAVRQTAAAKLVASEVASGNPREAVETAAARVVEVVRSHRKDLLTAREEASALLVELRDTRLNLEAIEVAIDESGQTSDRKRRMHQAISLSERAATLRELSNSLHKIVALERQAFSIDPKGGEQPDPANSPERKAAVEQELDGIFNDPQRSKPAPDQT